ncbi:MAG: aminoglycoside phosphotransferase family protein [Stackebrandtia sp.]
MLPEKVRRTAQSRGPAGREWLARLPEHLDHLRTAWSLTLGQVLDGGTTSLVVRVRSGNRDAVLKIAPDGPEFTDQIRTMSAADGHGYVHIYAHDPQRNAALMEPLGPALANAGTQVEQQLDVLSATLVQAWRVPRPDDVPAHTSTNKAVQLIELITALWNQLGEPCPRRLIDQALYFAERRAKAHDFDACVLCHGDPHPDNALAVPQPRPGAESGYVFVDPDGLLAEPAYDLGVALRGWTDEVLGSGNPQALLRGYCRRLAMTAGIDEAAIWEWGFVERVSSGLYLLRHGHETEGLTYLASANRLMDH